MAPSPQSTPSPSRPAEVNNPPRSTSHTGAILLGVLLTLAIVIVLSLLALYFLRRRRAHNLGEAPPSFLPFSNPFSRGAPAYSRNYPARGGPIGWLQTQYKKVRSGRTARGAYEGNSNMPGLGSDGARGGRFAQLDPDEAWDSRVGAEADVYADPSHTAYTGAGGHGGYYEEQELGLAHHQRGNSEVYGYAPASGAEEGERAVRGKSVLDERYEDETAPRGGAGERLSRGDPFGDHVEKSSMRGVSPRPVDTSGASYDAGQGRLSLDDSPTAERRSVFHEQM